MKNSHSITKQTRNQETKESIRDNRTKKTGITSMKTRDFGINKEY